MPSEKNYDAELFRRRLENADPGFQEFVLSLADEERDAILNISEADFEDMLSDLSENHPAVLSRVSQQVISCFTEDDHEAVINRLTREQCLTAIINLAKIINQLPEEQRAKFKEPRDGAQKSNKIRQNIRYERDFHKDILHNQEFTKQQKLEFCVNERERNTVKYFSLLTRYISPDEKERIRARQAAEIVGMDDAQLIEYYNNEEKVEKLKWARQLLEDLCDRLDARDNPIIEAERRRGKLTKKEREEIAKVEAEIAAEESGVDNIDKDSLFVISHD